MNNSVDEVLTQLAATVDFHRGLVLDAVEAEVGDEPVWPALRSRILKALGDRGLEGRVRGMIASLLD